MDLKFVLASALTMEESDKVVIPCYSQKEAESVRVRLYRLKKLIQNGEIVRIKKSTIEDTHVVILTRKGPKIVIESIPETKSLFPSNYTDLKRMVQMAILDGHDPEEVSEMFSSFPAEELGMLIRESLKFKQMTEEEEKERIR